MEEEEASTSQSSHFSRDDEDEMPCEMPWPAYSTVFDFRPNLSNNKNLVFVCKFCIGGKIIHANKSSSSNLKKHIKTCKESAQYHKTILFVSNMQHEIAKHPYKLNDIEKTKTGRTNKRCNEEILESSNKKQQILERWGSGSIAVTRKTLDDAILRFVIDDIQPLSVLDSSAFINLVRIRMPSSIRIMCRKTLRAKLDKLYGEMKIAIEKQLSQTEVISSTADLWSKAKRSYLGVTVHWINSETERRGNQQH